MIKYIYLNLGVFGMVRFPYVCMYLCIYVRDVSIQSENKDLDEFDAGAPTPIQENLVLSDALRI